MAWWRHQMETFSASLAICAGNSPVPGEFPTQRPVTRSFDVYFDLHPNERLSKQSWGWWYETLSWSLWRHCNDGVIHKCIRPLSIICIMKILCTWKKCLQEDTIILAFTKRVRCLIYNERICVLLKKGVFYWTSKSAISVEKQVLFFLHPKSGKWEWFSNLGTSMCVRFGRERRGRAPSTSFKANPADTWPNNNVVRTSKRRRNVGLA